VFEGLVAAALTFGVLSLAFALMSLKKSIRITGNRSGVVRFLLTFLFWILLSLLSGAVLFVTFLALGSPLGILFLASLILLGWWMWGGRLRPRPKVVTQGGEVAAGLVIALLCSYFLYPFIIVRAEPVQQEINIDFTWQGRHVGGRLKWNATTAATTTTPPTSGPISIGDFWSSVPQGIGEGCIDIIRGLWPPTALQDQHDAAVDLGYLSLITDITKLQDLIRPQESLIIPSGKVPVGDWQDHQTKAYVKDPALAAQLGYMDNKEFKEVVADNPSLIGQDVDRYVQDAAWPTAAANLLTFNALAASDAYHRASSQTGDWFQGLSAAGRTFCLSAPFIELYNAWQSGDGRRFGKALAGSIFTACVIGMMLDSAYNALRGTGP
jgi:hypothetical protein